MTEMLCKDCDAIVLFVVPECEDGHDDCGDLMCVMCGAALTFGGMFAQHDSGDDRTATSSAA